PGIAFALYLCRQQWERCLTQFRGTSPHRPGTANSNEVPYEKHTEHALYADPPGRPRRDGLGLGRDLGLGGDPHRLVRPDLGGYGLLLSRTRPLWQPEPPSAG